MVEHVHTIVIGAGAVGLAMVRRLAPQAGSLVVLEREDAIGTGTSSRNSEVIHAGRYYPAGTLKARSCVEGRRMLYSYCAERGIAHQRLGKLIVATEPAQRDALRQIAERAQVNGLTTPDDALQWLDAAQAQSLEPALRCGRPPPASSTPTASCWPARVTWSVPGGCSRCARASWARAATARTGGCARAAKRANTSCCARTWSMLRACRLSAWPRGSKAWTSAMCRPRSGSRATTFR